MRLIGLQNVGLQNLQFHDAQTKGIPVLPVFAKKGWCEHSKTQYPACAAGDDRVDSNPMSVNRNVAVKKCTSPALLTDGYCPAESVIGPVESMADSLSGRKLGLFSTQRKWGGEVFFEKGDFFQAISCKLQAASMVFQKKRIHFQKYGLKFPNAKI